MVYEALASLLILKHNIHFFNKKINKISFSNTNFILDHHNTFNQMSQSQSSMKKKRKTTNLKNTINSVQSAYYISLMNAHSVNNIKHHKKQQKLQEKQNKAKKTKQIKQSKKQNGKSGINETAIQKSVNEPMAILLKQFNGDELIQNCDKIYEKMNGLLG